MKKALIIAAAGMLLSVYATPVIAQADKCGQQLLTESIVAQHPAFTEVLVQMKASQKARTEAYKQRLINNPLAKITNDNTIPIVFHIVLDSAEINQIGGVSGIAERLDSQIAVINRDYNAMNPDNIKIPTPFQSLYGNVGIHFGLAHTDPNGLSTPGYEIIYTTATGIDETGTTGSTYVFSDAKYMSTGGANAWDPTTYLNVWIINPLGASGLLGVTIPQSYTVSSGIPQDEKGIVLNYGAFGVKVQPGQYYVTNITLGRTLTHELGHFFEIWHTWGDDNGKCPWNGGSDDGIADTPPQADATYGCPVFPKYDVCDTSGNPADNGIMFMNFMDYTNDNCMYLFTQDQAAQMQSTVAQGGESYSLTQHPEVLSYPVSVTNVEKRNPFNIFPNPTSGLVKVSFNKAPASLQSITITNVLGQNIQGITTNNQQSDTWSFDLSGMNKGIYFVQCHFTEGTVTRKIILQ